ncbi:Ig-like domain-containing protein [Pseudarthrobacter sp. B4EP4b]|uniref:CBM96 family carbohydrate-binding protein n=1 Tax=Pseudarthrobacter sp. B4EP4b TaxID=2590664 RepID=UPI0021080F5C|nr:Ig-like domain-containing protein [Pseudarthrobacter sp. B4EP4b]
MLTALLVALAALVVPGVASAAAGDVGIEGPSHSGTGTPTGTKRATNALWFNDGFWWGNLWDTVSQDFHIFRFNSSTNSWVNTGVATETRASTHHDVLWDGTGNTLYVASYRFVNDGLPAEPNFPTTMRRYSYDANTDKYTLLGSSQINNSKVEVLTIDKDSTGRVWASWQEKNRIYMNVTATDGKTWGTPFAHPASLSNVSVDDTSSVIAFDGKMGVMWSRQVGDATDGMYWSVHTDGAASNAWTDPVAAVKGLRSGDDHMNLKWLDASAGGKVFAAIKTSFTSSSQPLIQLLAFNGTAWTAHTIATVAECPNRVIVMIDEAAQKIRTFATYPKPSGTTNAGVCTSSGGAIYEKSTSLSNINFTTAKTARIVDADQYVHNVTSTKQNLNSNTSRTANSGLLVLADVNATNRYWHYYDGTGGAGGTVGTPDTSAPTVTATTPADTATGVDVASNVTASFNETVDPSTITSTNFTLKAGTTTVSATVTPDATNKAATLNPNTNLAADTLYTATISGVKDATGNVMAAAKSWTFRTAAVATTPPAGTLETVTVPASADTYASSASPATNFGTSTMLGVDNSPVEVGYLKFSLPAAPSGKTLQSATLQLKSAGSGSTGKQNVKLVADDTWTETGITSNSRPTLGASLGTLGPTSVNTDYNVVLDAAAVRGELGQPLSIGLDSASSDGLDLNSRESGDASAPKLVLTFQ